MKKEVLTSRIQLPRILIHARLTQNRGHPDKCQDMSFCDNMS